MCGCTYEQAGPGQTHMVLPIDFPFDYMTVGSTVCFGLGEYVSVVGWGRGVTGNLNFCAEIGSRHGFSLASKQVCQFVSFVFSLAL